MSLRLSSRSQAVAEVAAQKMLNALARDINKHPKVLRPIDSGPVEHLRSLVAGVEVDLDQPLPASDQEN